MKSKWYHIKVCSVCHIRLTENQRMYSHGICPHCGVDSCSTGCSTIKVILRSVAAPNFTSFFDFLLKMITFKAFFAYHETLDEESKEIAIKNGFRIK